ncbi:mitochondrial inner membrane protease subunit 1-like [Quillaja saponaria]|uniref:Mitochondrial inner membrane protease subunit 1-like n=1 Tax=Quillaja saponaria TaxID=32244 RepID=A0AAD7P9N5_QUISA|nr:mitochondrial inner membrane protease subunit 1-like [Quillaja saponaria]
MVGLGSMGKFGSIVKEGLDQVIFVAKLFCGLHVTNTYLCSIALSYGPSMLPTISLDNSLLLVEKMTTHFGKFGHGDIVLVRSPENPRKVITKRLTGMEGDSISYLVDPKNSDRSETIVVPRGHVWVQGDNIYASNDSRHFGPVPYGLLEGRVFWRIWPPKSFGTLGKTD